MKIFTLKIWRACLKAPSLRISPLLLMLVISIALLYAPALSFNAVYNQGIGIFSGLFISSLLPVKPKRLSKSEKEAFSLPEELKQILVGLLMGDLHIYKQKLGVNPCLMFIQGLIHKDYIFHLYSLFESYCRMAPVISKLSPDKRTRKSV